MNKYCYILVILLTSIIFPPIEAISQYEKMRFVENKNNDNDKNDDLYKELSKLSIPIIRITTENAEEPTCDYVSHPEGCVGASITNATKVPSRMELIENGEIIYDSGDYIKKGSGLTIKIRGNTSAYKKKKSFKLKLQKKADLLFRDGDSYKDKDWVLLNSGTTLNTKVGFWLSELIGLDYTPQSKLVNLFINDTYRGLYYLAESVSVNQGCRIDIDEDEGYVLEYDAYFWNEDISFPSHIGQAAMAFTYKYPDSEDVTEEMNQKISEDIWNIEDQIKNNNYVDVVDCMSVVRWLLGWDILGSGDPAGTNIFIVKKDEDSKVKMGPMWDFDKAFEIRDRWPDVRVAPYFWFTPMIYSTDRTFMREYSKMWHEQGHSILDSLRKKIDYFEQSTEGTDYAKSLTIESQYSDYNEDGEEIASMETMIDDIIDFLDERQIWLDNNVANESYSGLDDVKLEYDDNKSAYDILGRPVGENYKGLVIKNHKKIIAK